MCIGISQYLQQQTIPLLFSSPSWCLILFFFLNYRILFMVYKQSRWLTAPLQVTVVYSLS